MGRFIRKLKPKKRFLNSEGMKEIQDLLEQKPFEALSVAERNSVLAEMTEQEYRQSFQLLEAAQVSFSTSNLSPNGNVYQNLSTAFHKKHRTTQGVTSWLFFKIPIWTVLLGMLLLVGSYFYFSKNDASTPRTMPIVEPIYVYQTDTIYLEKEVEKVILESPNRIRKEKNRPIAQQENKSNEALLEPLLTYLDTNAVKEIDSQVKGMRLDEDAPVIEVDVFR